MGLASGNTKVVFEMVDGFFNIYPDLISSVPFLCTPDCSGIGTQVILRIDIKHSAAGGGCAGIFAVTDSFGFNDCVEEFAVIFQQQYDNMLAMGMLGEDIQELEDYLDYFASMGEYDHKEDQPFYEALLSNILDLTIIKPLIESCCGYDLITGEDLSEMERSMKVVGALVDLVTLATGIYGFTTAAKSMGWKKAASYFSQLALVELASDVSATTVATIGEYCDWPMGVTLLLSLATGLTVGQIGNHLIFERNGIEIFRKEVIEKGTEVPNEVKRIDEIKVEFNYKAKYNEAEFARQLADQQKGMNELTVQEYLENRKKYIDQGRAIESNAAQQAARQKAFEKKVYELQQSGLSLNEAEKQAQKWLDTQAALHNPDQVAGGKASNIGGVGDKSINSSIGIQWRYRIDDVDKKINEIAETMSDTEKRNTYLNVILLYKGE